MAEQQKQLQLREKIVLITGASRGIGAALRKHLYPEDVAGTIAFLACDEASMLTGSHILITGGSHLQL